VNTCKDFVLAAVNGVTLGCLRTVKVQQHVEELPRVAQMSNVKHAYGNSRVVHNLGDDQVCLGGAGVVLFPYEGCRREESSVFVVGRGR